MQYVVKKVIKETNDVVTLVLDVPNDTIEYEAGQFITLIFSDRNGKEERRSYSLSSIPDEPLSITVKRIPNGSYSRVLVEKVKVGDQLMGLQPAGFFTLPDKSRILANTIFVFFAAGSGITPIYSQIKSLLKSNMAEKIILVYSNQSKKDVIFYEELMKLSSDYRLLFTIYFFFSDETDYRKARLSSSIVSEILTNEVGNKRSHTWLYLCGPFQYMLMITIVARGMGFMNEQIRKEQFVIEQSSITVVPPDITAHNITIIENGKQISWISQYPDTILQSAKRNGIRLPYSCEAGQCGTCSATCIKGTVWMYKNEVLMEDEIERGRVLTCTGYPINGDIQLEITSAT